jgi:hypothetical protein
MIGEIEHVISYIEYIYIYYIIYMYHMSLVISMSY